MTKPVRLHFPRGVKGFSLEAVSRSVNGLPGKRVTRPSKWGNSFRVGKSAKSNGRSVVVADAAMAVRLHRTFLSRALRTAAPIELRGMNLACACKLCPRHQATGLALGEACAECDPCHADTLLAVANPPVALPGLDPGKRSEGG